MFGNRYRFVVAVTKASFTKKQTSFLVRKIEVVFPRGRRLSSADTVIPATSWDIDTPMVEPTSPVQISSAAEPGPSNQVNNIPTGPVVIIPTNTHVNATPENKFVTSPNVVNYTQRVADRKTISNVQTSPGCSTQTLLGRLHQERKY